MSDYRCDDLLAPFRRCLREHAEKLKAELADGVDAEREEEIRIWLAFHKKNLAMAELEAKAMKHLAPAEFLQPRFEN